jgi:hypothetical protein
MHTYIHLHILARKYTQNKIKIDQPEPKEEEPKPAELSHCEKPKPPEYIRAPVIEPRQQTHEIDHVVVHVENDHIDDVVESDQDEESDSSSSVTDTRGELFPTQSLDVVVEEEETEEERVAESRTISTDTVEHLLWPVIVDRNSSGSQSSSQSGSQSSSDPSEDGHWNAVAQTQTETQTQTEDTRLAYSEPPRYRNEAVSIKSAPKEWEWREDNSWKKGDKELHELLNELSGLVGVMREKREQVQEKDPADIRLNITM